MAIVLRDLRLIQDGRILGPSDYSFENGSVGKASKPNSTDFEEVIDCSDFLASKGWIDLRCGLGEPGEEYRETVESLCQSLTASGFVQALIMPNTNPVIQSKK
ncbi:hypothetical protein [Algoriphagus boritolerans]|uniref:hypothetical protein n=1 Tax=Algoriphagus boritolerans TaxID=308111 RepID=UPI000B33F28D